MEGVFLDETEDIFEVESIIDYDIGENGKKYFRVRWKGYGPEDDTWEPYTNLLTCDNLVKDFMRNQKKKKKKKRKKEEREQSRLKLGDGEVHSSENSRDSTVSGSQSLPDNAKQSQNIVSKAAASPDVSEVDVEDVLGDSLGLTRQSRKELQRIIAESKMACNEMTTPQTSTSSKGQSTKSYTSTSDGALDAGSDTLHEMAGRGQAASAGSSSISISPVSSKASGKKILFNRIKSEPGEDTPSSMPNSRPKKRLLIVESSSDSEPDEETKELLIKWGEKRFSSDGTSPGVRRDVNVGRRSKGISRKMSVDIQEIQRQNSQESLKSTSKDDQRPVAAASKMNPTEPIKEKRRSSTPTVEAIRKSMDTGGLRQSFSALRQNLNLGVIGGGIKLHLKASSGKNAAAVDSRPPETTLAIKSTAVFAPPPLLPVSSRQIAGNRALEDGNTYDVNNSIASEEKGPVQDIVNPTPKMPKPTGSCQAKVSEERTEHKEFSCAIISQSTQVNAKDNIVSMLPTSENQNATSSASCSQVQKAAMKIILANESEEDAGNQESKQQPQAVTKQLSNDPRPSVTNHDTKSAGLSGVKTLNQSLNPPNTALSIAIDSINTKVMNNNVKPDLNPNLPIRLAKGALPSDLIPMKNNMVLIPLGRTTGTRVSMKEICRKLSENGVLNETAKKLSPENAKGCSNSEQKGTQNAKGDTVNSQQSLEHTQGEHYESLVTQLGNLNHECNNLEEEPMSSVQATPPKDPEPLTPHETEKLPKIDSLQGDISKGRVETKSKGSKTQAVPMTTAKDLSPTTSTIAKSKEVLNSNTVSPPATQSTSTSDSFVSTSTLSSPERSRSETISLQSQPRPIKQLRNSSDSDNAKSDFDSSKKKIVESSSVSTNQAHPNSMPNSPNVKINTSNASEPLLIAELRQSNKDDITENPTRNDKQDSVEATPSLSHNTVSTRHSWNNRSQISLPSKDRNKHLLNVTKQTEKPTSTLEPTKMSPRIQSNHGINKMVVSNMPQRTSLGDSGIHLEFTKVEPQIKEQTTTKLESGSHRLPPSKARLLKGSLAQKKSSVVEFEPPKQDILGELLGPDDKKSDDKEDAKSTPVTKLDIEEKPALPEPENIEFEEELDLDMDCLDLEEEGMLVSQQRVYHDFTDRLRVVQPIKLTKDELKSAVLNNKLDRVLGALAARCNPDVVDSESGYSLLMLAISSGNKDIARALLWGGADPNYQTHDGVTALMLAVEMGDRGLISSLIMNGGFIESQKPNGESALTIACRHGYPDIVVLLLNYGADAKLLTPSPAVPSTVQQHSIKAIIDKHNERLRELMEHFLSQFIMEFAVVAKPAVLPCRCLASRDNKEQELYFEFNRNPCDPGISIVFLCLPAEFHPDGSIRIKVAEVDNGVKSVSLNGKKQCQVIPGDCSLYILFPNFGQVNHLSFRTVESKYKLLVAVYAIQLKNELLRSMGLTGKY